MQLAIRVDASHAIGTGHLMRCLELARVLRLEEIRCVFIAQENSLVQRLLSGSDFHLVTISAESLGQDALETGHILQREEIDAVLVDHYHIDQSWQRKIDVKRLFVIDDLADRPHDCHILIDTSTTKKKGLYRKLTPTGCSLLLGPEFAIIRDEFLRSFDVDFLFDLFICFGGTDPDNDTLAALTQLEDHCTHMRICVVVGAGFTHYSDLEKWIRSTGLAVELFKNPSNFAMLMAGSKQLVIAAGSMLFEAASLGKAIIMIKTAENQTDNLELFSGYRAALAARMRDLPEAISHLGVCGKKYARQAKLLCDGQGKYRLSAKLKQSMEEGQCR